MESLHREKSPEQNGSGSRFDSAIDDRDYAGGVDPGSAGFVPEMSAWTPKAASYRIAPAFPGSYE